MKKVLMFLLIFTLSSIVIGSKTTEIKLVAAETPITLSSTKNHILADVSVPVMRTGYLVDGSFGKVSLTEGTLTSLSPEVVIDATSITVSQKGVFQLNFSYSSINTTLYVFSKLSSESEYVLFEENFTYPNGALPAHLTTYNNLGEVGGSAAIDNGRLSLSAYTIVLFPSYLQSFTNYIIEADARMTYASATSRWTSVMFRYTKENYFQMAVRQDTTVPNGVEFAKRISGAWNVPATASFTEVLNPATTYKFKIDVLDATVKQSINDQLLVTYENAIEYTHGRIGVQADNVNVLYDNIKITMPVEYIEVERYDFQPVANVYQPTTNIVNPATSVMWFNELSQLTIFDDVVRPATSIFRIDDQLNVVNANSNILLTVEEALIAVDGKVIPAFYVEDPVVATELAAYLRLSRIFDVFIVSPDQDVILAARAEYQLMRGLYLPDLSSYQTLSETDAMDLRRQTNTAQAVAVLIPVELLNREIVEYMQKRLMTVWAISSDDEVSQYKAILSGVQGIVTQDYEQLFSLYQTFGPNTHVRRPLTIAHRGLSQGLISSGPENTLESSREALAMGADILELDVHLTLDLEVVVIHDATTNRTAPGYPGMTVSQSTLAQLKDINLVDNVSGRTDIKIPTLREYLLEFKGTGVIIFIEIKPTIPMLVQEVANIVNELDMYDQSVVITFGSSNITEMNVVMPEMSNGLLNSSILNVSNVNTSLTNTFSNIVTINATLNPNYGALTKDFLLAINHRGVTVWPWTLNEFPMLTTYYNYGVGGYTTDFMSYFNNTFNRLEFDNYHLTYQIGQSSSLSIRGSIQTQTGTSYPFMPNMTIIDDGGTNVSFNASGTLLSTSQVGKVYMFTTFTSSLPDGKTLTLASDLFQLDIIDEHIINLENSIAQIPDEITLTNRSQIESIRLAYNALSANQQQFIETEDLLIAAEQVIGYLINEAEMVDEMIQFLPTTVSLSQENVMELIRAELDELSPEQLLLVTRLTNFEQREQELILLLNEVEDVIEKINSIGSIDLSSKEALLSARFDYNELTAEQKERVTNYSTLVEGEEIYQELVEQRTSTIIIISVSIASLSLIGFFGFMFYKKKRIIKE